MSVTSNGYRGVVRLGAGQFDISGTLSIRNSGIILEGAGDGDSTAPNTVLRWTYRKQSNQHGLKFLNLLPRVL